jgi:hypothetical protein
VVEYGIEVYLVLETTGYSDSLLSIGYQGEWIMLELPDTVRRAWGAEVAHDFVTWLEDQLRDTVSTPKVPISALVARQKVNVLMLEHVSNLLLANTPTLVRLPDDKWVWRVPIDLTFPGHGRVGCVGTLDVDAHYGEVRYSDTSLAQISAETQRLAEQALHPTA